MKTNDQTKSVVRDSVAALLGLGLVGLLFWGHYERAGGGRFINQSWLEVLIWLVPVAVMAEAMRRHGQLKGTDTCSRTHRAEFILLGAMLLYLFTEATRDVWFYFLSWVPRQGEGMGGFNHALNEMVLIVALIWPVLLLVRGRLPYALLLPIAFVAAQLTSAMRLLRVTGGDALYRDDHPSFMLRLDQGADILPHLEAYVPFWNGGVVDRAIGETGATAPAMLLWPLWRFAEIHEVYTYGFAFIYIILLPWMCVAAIRWMGLGWRPAAIAGMLGLAVSQDYFTWVLHFGTLGAGISSTCILPFSALLYRVVHLRKTDWRTLVPLVLVAFFLVQWPPGFIMAGVCTVSLLIAFRQGSVRTWACLVACGLAALLLDARMLAALALKSQALMGFVLTQPHEHAAVAEVVGMSWRDGWVNVILPTFKKMNPMLVFFGIAGLAVMRDSRLKHWIWPPMLILVVVATWVSPHFKELQLERMTLPMMFLAIVPASLLAADCLEPVTFRRAPLQAALLALIILTGLNASRIYANQGPAPYVALSEPVQSLATYIRENVPEGGRAMFLGHNVHAYGGGHVAYLPRLAQRELMSCDYYHFPIKMIEYDYPPRPYREPEPMLRFIEAYNVTHIITRFDQRRDDLLKRGAPYVFDRTLNIANVPAHIFTVQREASPFASNSGTVTATFNRFDVTLDDPDAEAVIRYNFSENLKPSGAAELFPYEVDERIRLIGIRPNGEKTIRIKYRSWF